MVRIFQKCFRNVPIKVTVCKIHFKDKIDVDTENKLTKQESLKPFNTKTYNNVFLIICYHL